MAGIASQFIDLSDGEYHLIPANAINLVLYMESITSIENGTLQILHSLDKDNEDDVHIRDMNGNPNLFVASLRKGLNTIPEAICQYIKVSDLETGKSAILNYGVS